MASIFSNESKDKIMENGLLTIRGNIFALQNSFIQIANISRVRVDHLPQRSYKIPIILALVGVVLFSMRISLWGVLLILAGIGMGVFVFQNNSLNKYGLFLEMNSGASAIYPSPNIDFLNRAANVLANIVEGNIEGNITINFTDNSIKDVRGVVVSGDGKVESITT